MSPTEALAAQLAAHRPPSNHIGYPPELRARVGIFVRERLAEGGSLTELARSLGVSRHSLAQWSGATAAGHLVPVVLTEEPQAVEAGAVSRRLTLVSPAGFRLEGLELDEAIRALRRLA